MSTIGTQKRAPIEETAVPLLVAENKDQEDNTAPTERRWTVDEIKEVMAVVDRDNKGIAFKLAHGYCVAAAVAVCFALILTTVASLAVFLKARFAHDRWLFIHRIAISPWFIGRTAWKHGVLAWPVVRVFVNIANLAGFYLCLQMLKDFIVVTKMQDDVVRVNFRIKAPVRSICLGRAVTSFLIAVMHSSSLWLLLLERAASPRYEVTVHAFLLDHLSMKVSSLSSHLVGVDSGSWWSDLFFGLWPVDAFCFVPSTLPQKMTQRTIDRSKSWWPLWNTEIPFSGRKRKKTSNTSSPLRKSSVDLFVGVARLVVTIVNRHRAIGKAVEASPNVNIGFYPQKTVVRKPHTHLMLVLEK